MSGALQGKRALVTGGSRGIGRAIALAFAREGARVAICHPGDPEAYVTLVDLKEFDPEALEIRADVSVEQDVCDMVAEIGEAFGGLDVLVNNAGILREKPLLETSAAEFDEVIAVNLKGVFLCMKYQINQFLAQGGGGAIVNTASVAGIVGGIVFVLLLMVLVYFYLKKRDEKAAAAAKAKSNWCKAAGKAKTVAMLAGGGDADKAQKGTWRNQRPKSGSPRNPPCPP